MKVPVSTIRWQPSYRLIPTRYPDVDVYQRVSNPGDRDALRQIETLTNDRVRQAKGTLQRLRPGDYFQKSKSSYNVEAAFAYSTKPSRFNRGSYGVYYTAKELETAVAETVYQTTLLMSATNERPMHLQKRVIVSEIRGKFHDIRRRKARFKDLYNRSSYTASQDFAFKLWSEGSGGILYDSVRRSRGECAAVFSPQLVRHVHQERCMMFEWDGKRVDGVFELHEYPF